MIEPIRILHVLGRLNRGGAETLVMNLYRSIDRSQYQFDFMVHTDEVCAYDDEILSLGGKIHRISQYKGKNHFRYIKEWRAFFEANPDYRIIHGHIRSVASIYLKLAKQYNRQTIIHSHATGSRGNSVEQLVKNIFQFPIRYQSQHFFACSTEAAVWLFGKQKAKQTVVLKNAVDLESFRFNPTVRERIRKGRLEDKYVVGHVGSFTAPKNYKFLVEVFAQIALLRPDAMLVLVGDGELRSQVESDVETKGLTENIMFLGSRKEIPELLMGMDVFVFPSFFEGFGMAALEAQVAGLPTHVADTLPPEIEITDLLSFHALSKAPSQWAKDILVSSAQTERSDRVDVVRQQGYDIKDQAQFLMEYYHNML